MTTPNVEVNFRANGLDNVRNGLRVLKNEAEPTGRQWGVASRQIAGALESVARQGKVTGEALKQVLHQGSEMAFMFGPEGALVGALAVTGLAIYEHLVGGMKSAQDEAKKTADSIRDLVNAGDKAGIYKQMSAAWRGTPGANFEDGVSGLSSQAAFLEAKLRREDPHNYAREHKGLASEAQLALAAAVDRANAKLREQRTLFLQLQMAYNAPMPYQGAGMLPGMTSSASGKSPLNAPLTNLLGRGTLDVSVFERMGYGVGGKVQTPFLDLGSPFRKMGTPGDSPATLAAVESMKSVGEMAGRGFVDTLGDTIQVGVSKLFEKGANIGGVFAAIADTALSGLGSIAVQIGRQFLTTFKFVGVMVDALKKLSPAIGIGAAIGLIAFGSALGGAGHRIAANAGGGGGGGYGGGYSSGAGYGGAIIDRGIIDPTRGNVSARSASNYNFTVIGTNDAVAQRDIMKLIRNAETRGDI